jgi:hypothetical protein
VQTANPFAVVSSVVSGFVDDDGVSYTPVANVGNYDDSVFPAGAAPYRMEIWPSSYSGSVSFLTILWPAGSGTAAPPSITVIDDGSWFGARIDPSGSMIDAKMAKGDTHSASVSGFVPPPPTLPADNQDRRSYGTHPFRTVLPYGDDSAVGRLDRPHAAWLARKESQPIPVDLSQGEDLVCTEPALDGAAIESPAPVAGADISTVVPAPEAGAEIGC